MSDSNAKSSPTKKAGGGSGTGGSGKGGGRGAPRRSSLGDIGNALSAAYKDTLKEDVPPDILALLGKLD